MKYIVTILFLFLTLTLFGQGAGIRYVDSIPTNNPNTDIRQSVMVYNRADSLFYIYKQGVWTPLDDYLDNTLYIYDNSLAESLIVSLQDTLTGDTVSDIISGVIVPVMINAKQRDTITLPSEFTFDPGIDIIRNGDGFFTSIDNIKDFRESYFPGGKSYYVDPYTGSNSNTGLSADEAFATYDFARTRSDVAAIYLKGAIYDGITTFLTNKTNYQLIGYGGRPIIGKIESQKVWVDEGDGVWSTTVTDTLSWPVDLLTKGPLGEPSLFERAGSIAGLEKPSTYFYEIDGTNNLYIHTTDGNEPNNYSNVLIVDAGTISFGTSTNYYFENITLLGALNLSNSGSNYYFRDCDIFYAPSTNLILVTDGNIVLSNVKAAHSSNDIFNYTTGSTVIEHNVTAKYAGYNTSGSDNQISTGHSASEIITINGDYSMASNQIIFDVNADTKRLILGGKFGGSFNLESAATGTISSGNASGDFSEIWIDRATIGGDMGYDILVNFGIINLKNVIINNTSTASVSNGGTIKLY